MTSSVKPLSEGAALFATPNVKRSAQVSNSIARGRVDSLDGIRTIAVLAVMMVHAGFPGAELGWLGVDIFFVLSGFLITTLLCVEKQRKGEISLPKFWARRFLRLMPAYWLYIGSLTSWMLLHPTELSWTGQWNPTLYLFSLWGYFVNYLPMGGIWDHQKLTLHLWSLAVEEQFYFIWPVVAYIAFRFRRPWALAWAVVVAVLIRRCLTEPMNMGSLLSTRGIGIVLGCATAMTLAHVRRPKVIESSRARIVVLCIVVCAIAGLTAVNRAGILSEQDIRATVLTWLCALFALLLAMLWYGPSDSVSELLASRPMAYLGQISYGMYLYHMFAHFLVWDCLLSGIESWNRYLKYGIRFTSYILVTIAISSLSYYLVEVHFLRLKNRLR